MRTTSFWLVGGYGFAVCDCGGVGLCFGLVVVRWLWVCSLQCVGLCFRWMWWFAVVVVCDVWVCVLGGCGGLRLWWLLAWLIDLGVDLPCILGSGLMVVAGFG